MKTIIFISFLMISMVAQSNTPGFGIGDTLSYSNLYGNVSVTCFDKQEKDHAFYRCRTSFFEPSRYSYFYGPEGIEAKKVSLVATWENGKVVKKTRRYDSKKFRSKQSINLANTSLTQRPLLNDGENNIVYKLLSGSEIVSEGEFIVTIIQNESRTCRDGHIVSHNGDDCRNSSRICREYFRRYNYCK